MRHLSKSKILAFRQCPKRLWLEIHQPELRDDSGAQTAFQIGNEVGEIARSIFDIDDKGTLIDIAALGFEEAFAQSAELLSKGEGPVFEAGVKAEGALAFSDVMLPAWNDGVLSWEMIEVKSSTSVKDYHYDDIALQGYVAEAAGIKLTSISLAHLDNQFVYPGGGDYHGLFHREDFTDATKSRRTEVAEWLTEAQSVAALNEAPDICTGAQCHEPFTCPFWATCHGEEEAAEYPLASLPRLNVRKRAELESQGITDVRDVPDEYLTSIQIWVRDLTRSGETYFDADGAAADLGGNEGPALFLDFETAMFSIPIWKGTRPYQQIPFQYSLHRVDTDGSLTHEAFVDLSGNDPSESLAGALIEHASEDLPVFVYNARFETCILNELAHRFPELQEALQSIVDRVVDLYPIAQRRFYHRSQQGSWGLKSVLPAVCPDLSYEHLEGVADGGMAMEVFNEALAPETAAERKAEIEQQLLDYCHLDTLALVRLREFFAARTQPDPSDFLAVKIDVSEDQIPNRKA